MASHLAKEIGRVSTETGLGWFSMYEDDVAGLEEVLRYLQGFQAWVLNCGAYLPELVRHRGPLDPGRIATTLESYEETGELLTLPYYELVRAVIAAP